MLEVPLQHHYPLLVDLAHFDDTEVDLALVSQVAVDIVELLEQQLLAFGALTVSDLA